MKRYSLNKDFIPQSFVRKYEKEVLKKNKKSVILIALSVLLFLPDSITYIFSNSYNKKENCVNEEISTVNNIKDESFYKWMDIIKDDTEGTFNDNSAVIYTDGINNLKEILSNKKLVVDNVEDSGDRKYKVQIKLS